MSVGTLLAACVLAPLAAAAGALWGLAWVAAALCDAVDEALRRLFEN